MLNELTCFKIYVNLNGETVSRVCSRTYYTYKKQNSLSITYARQFDIILLSSFCSRSVLSMISFYLNCCMSNFKPVF